MIIIQTIIAAIVIIALAHLIAGKSTSNKTVREIFSWKYMVEEWKQSIDGPAMVFLCFFSVVLLVFALYNGFSVSAEIQQTKSQCVGGQVIAHDTSKYCATNEQVDAFNEKQKSDNDAFIKSLKVIEQLK